MSLPTSRAFRLLPALRLVGTCAIICGCTKLSTTGVVRTGSGEIAYSLFGAVGPVVVLQSGLGDGRSPGARQIERVEGASHNIQKDRPEVVVSAIEEVATESRTVII